MSNAQLSAKALNAPLSTTTIIGTSTIKLAIEASHHSPRKRIILPFHKNTESSLHRMINAIQPYSYIQPHRHLHPPKAESVIVLQGAILSFVFDLSGAVEETQVLAAGSVNLGIDSEPGVFHTFLALQENTALFEVKPGPYEPNSDKDFALWAPPENSPEADDYMVYLYSFANQHNCKAPKRG